MTNSDHPEGAGGPVPQPAKHSVPKRIEGEESMGRSPKPFIVAGLAFMFVSLAAMFGGIYFAIRPHVHPSHATLEIKQAADLDTALRHASGDSRFDQLAAEHGDARGKDFWLLCMRHELIERSMLAKCVSIASPTDERPSSDALFTGETVEVPWCSYTAPRLRDLPQVLERKGTERVVVFCFNSRNWNNYSGQGVLVMWSDGSYPCYMRLEDFRSFGITAEEWADPAGKLFGKKAPFQHTYE